MCVRRLKALLILLPVVDFRPGSQRKRSKAAVVNNILLQHDSKFRPLHIDTINADLASHQLHKLLDNAKPQPGAFDMAVLFFIHPPERIKDIRYILLFHSLPRIFHRIPDPDSVERKPLTPDREGDGTLARIFHRIVEEVDQNLLNAYFIAAEHARDRRVYHKLKLQPLLRPCLIRDFHNLHLSRFNLGKVQDVIDQRQKHLAGSLDISCVFRHILRDIPPQYDLI